MKIIKIIKCGLTEPGHHYEKAYERMIHAGMGKMIVHRCSKCGKEKSEFI